MKFLYILAGTGTAISLALSSCASLPTGGQSKVEANRNAQTGPPEIDGWRLVSGDPPTYFPDGVKKTTKTTYDHGEWVEGGKRGARWFIPHDGASGRSSRELAAEAFSMRSKEAKTENAVRKAADMTLKTGVAAGLLGGSVLMGLGAGPI